MSASEFVQSDEVCWAKEEVSCAGLNHEQGNMLLEKEGLLSCVLMGGSCLLQRMNVESNWTAAHCTRAVTLTVTPLLGSQPPPPPTLVSVSIDVLFSLSLYFFWCSRVQPPLDGLRWTTAHVVLYTTQSSVYLPTAGTKWDV